MSSPRRWRDRPTVERKAILSMCSAMAIPPHMVVNDLPLWRKMISRALTRLGQYPST